MLPDRCFHPLDLHDAIDDAYGDDMDDAAVRALITQALLDPRSSGDERVFDYAWECVEFFDDDLPAAVELMTQLIAAHPQQRFALGALRAALREPQETRQMLREITALHTELLLLPPHERDLRFYHLAPMALAQATDDDERGGHLAAEGIALATELGRTADAEKILMRSPGAEHQRAAKVRQDAVLEELHREFEAIHGWRGPSATATGKRALPEGYGAFRLAYLPERHYARGLADGLLDATYPLDHQHYRHELQEAARNNARIGKVCIVPLDIEGLLAFAERQGADPARRSTRLAYVGEVDTRGDIPWPPERNAPCWCGSGGKYKKCCGRPGFRQIVVPDRGQAIVRVELAGTDPLVWRRVAVPSRIRLDLLHDVLAAEMGWHGDHMYAFEIEGGQICDPRFSDDAPTADDCHLPELASEPGHTFIYRYDFDDDWVHTVTVEQIVAVDPAANEPRSLAAHGACPPQDCGGVPGYRRLLAALADPDHPRHDEALQRLGPHWDASTPTTG